MSRIYATSTLFAGVAVACAVILFSSAYTAERKWVPGQAPGDNISFEADFATALHECVATHDSEHLADLDQGYEYRISGWFLNYERTTVVIQCMRKKGWLATPSTLRTP
jgi:hypothetical protein